MSQSRKVAVVTGGASGIGLACAEMFSRTHHVVIGDLKNAEQAAAELPVAGTGRANGRLFGGRMREAGRNGVLAGGGGGAGPLRRYLDAAYGQDRGNGP